MHSKLRQSIFILLACMNASFNGEVEKPQSFTHLIEYPSRVSKENVFDIRSFW